VTVAINRLRNARFVRISINAHFGWRVLFRPHPPNLPITPVNGLVSTSGILTFSMGSADNCGD